MKRSTYHKPSFTSIQQERVSGFAENRSQGNIEYTGIKYRYKKSRIWDQTQNRHRNPKTVFFSQPAHRNAELN